MSDRKHEDDPRREELRPDDPTVPAEGLLQESTISAQPTAAGGTLPDVPGFKILRPIGEGGMGTVYEAEQETPCRRVALKVIRGAYVTEEQVRFFRREIESLGRLNHPSIAAIHGAGRTSLGQHFFAMELVRGVTLDDWIRGSRTPPTKTELRQRLELFVEICDAIQYAHQRGVIHRDLKPSNVVVTERAGSDSSVTHERPAAVKVLDFGLARITDADISLATTVADVGKIRGTLAYMSPEQARGDPDEIDLRTDIYSLGVILYELLTGERPYDIQKTLIPEAVRVICEEEPRRPSAVARTLRGDLETIIGKAMEKEPDRRYASAAVLADDVRRYLAAQPILARPPSTAYQLRKLVARHRFAVTGATAIFVMLLVMLAATSTLLRRSEVARGEAQAVIGFLRNMLSSVDPDRFPGRDVTVREVLAEAAQGISGTFSEQPRVEETLRETIAESYGSLGLIENAIPHVDWILEYRTRRFDEKDARTINALSWLAELHYEAGRNEESIRLHREAMGRAAFTLGRAHPVTLLSMTRLGNSLRIAAQFEEAEALQIDAIDLALDNLGEDDDITATALLNLGGLYRDTHRFDEAESLMMRAVEIRKRILGPGNQHTLRSLYELADVYGNAGRYEEALRNSREVFGACRQTLGDDHPETLAAQYRVAKYLRMNLELDEAEQMFEDVLARRRQMLGENDPSVGVTLHSLAIHHEIRGRYEAAAATCREALSVKQAALGEDHPASLQCMSHLGRMLAAAGRFSEAEPIARDALQRFRAIHPGPARIWEALKNLADVLGGSGRHREAEGLYREALELGQQALGEDHPIVASQHRDLGTCLASLGEFPAAEDHLLAAHRIVAASFGSDHAQTTAARDDLARFYESRGKPDRAREYRTGPDEQIAR